MVWVIYATVDGSDPSDPANQLREVGEGSLSHYLLKVFIDV